MKSAVVPGIEFVYEMKLCDNRGVSGKHPFFCQDVDCRCGPLEMGPIPRPICVLGVSGGGRGWKKNNTYPRMGASDVWDLCITWTLARFARSLIGSALRGPLRATLREALRFVGANLPVCCRLRSISLHCYVMARSAVLSADTRRLRAAPLARSLPLPRGRLTASPCRAEGAKGAAPPDPVCCAQGHTAETNQMRRPSLTEAARARLRPVSGLPYLNSLHTRYAQNTEMLCAPLMQSGVSFGARKVGNPGARSSRSLPPRGAWTRAPVDVRSALTGSAPDPKTNQSSRTPRRPRQFRRPKRPQAWTAYLVAKSKGQDP